MSERPMRVLWCVQLQPPTVRRHLGAEERHGPAAWVESLRLALRGRSDIALGIVSPGHEDYEPFEEQGVVYLNSRVPLGRRGRVGRLASRWGYALRANEHWDLTAAMARFLPDLLHIHGTEHPFGLSVPRDRVPQVVSLQGLPTAYERFYLRGLGAAHVAKLGLSTEFAHGTGVLHGYLRMRAMADRERAIMAAHGFFIGRTDWDRTVLESVNPEAVYLHCDEIMRAPFYSSRWRPQERLAPVVFSTSGNMIYKGSECLLEAAAILIRTGFPDLTVRIAGVPTDGQVARFYRRMAVRLGIETHVHWLGRLTAEDLVSELTSADVFVYPSRADNSPNALVEAMLVGAPIVSASTGGIPSLLADSQEGLLFPAGDPWALAGQARRLLSEPDTAARLGRAARARAIVRNDPDRVAERTVDIYRSVTAPGSATVR